MELDKGLELAVILAWNDLMTGRQLSSARVEYESKQGIPTDFLSVWTVMSWGYQDRVCDYRTSGSPAHPAGVSFSNSYHSDALVRALDFIMKNQDQFTRPVDAWRPHLVLIQPPTADQAAEAVAWMTGIEAPAITAKGLAEVAKPVDHRSGFPNGPFCR